MRRIRRQRGVAFTLVELVGVLAVLSILAAVLTPNVAWQIQRADARREDETLALLADALVRSIRENQAIPRPSTWAAVVAQAAGMPESAVTNPAANGTAGRRRFVVHPSFALSGGGTANVWTQSTAGLESLGELRMMIVSTRWTRSDNPLVKLESLTAGEFDSIWNWNAGSTSAVEALPDSLENRARYIHIQRIQLKQAFHRVTFSNEEYPTLSPGYQVGALNQTTLSSAARAAWYLEGTPLRLYQHAGAGGGLSLSHTVAGPVNFQYEASRWRIP